MANKRMTVLDWKKLKSEKTKISVLTCYDYTFARLANESNVDSLLVGDSLAMTIYGHDTTIPVDVETMCRHVEAVKRGAPNKFIIGDMPFLSYRQDLRTNMVAAEKLMKAGSHALKLEGAFGNEQFVHHLVESGVPVMGHIGLTPQSVHALGGYRVQGREVGGEEFLLTQAKKLEDAGCFAIVFECIPTHIARVLTEKLSIATIGIGAGPDTDGQVLVLQDMLGLNVDFQPKFVRKFADGQKTVVGAFNDYISAVKSGTFPSQAESFE